jgi:predicted nucleotidyltransferase component of viral defense system
MGYRDVYQRQVALLVRVLPLVAEEAVFALKGGTAINLFVRNLPRLSVDIDLTYLPVEPREASLAAIEAALLRVADRIRASIAGAQVNLHRLNPEKTVDKLLVQVAVTRVTIEVTPVLRGCVYDPVVMTVSEAVEAGFGFAEVQVVSFADLYAGKIVAALDRQHPRDLFDVRDLLAYEGLTDDLRVAFLIYLASHTRPMAEVLAPHPKDITHAFERSFDGMTETPVALEELLAARTAIQAAAVGAMPDAHRQFLLSFEAGNPNWELIGLPQAAFLPALAWRQQHLDSLAPERRAELVAALRAVLYPAASNAD